MPKLIITDSIRLKQILLNLIGNAIKFTDKGRISVTVEYLPKTNARSHNLQIHITDTGRGLSESEQEKLFKPFSQADASMTRKYGGTGLGLNLSKRLAELLGGDIVLSDSKPGVGSRFIVSLEIDLPKKVELIQDFEEIEASLLVKANTKPSSEKFRLQGFNFLVVDDLPDNRILVQRYIQAAGGKVEFANDGHEGIKKALDGKFDLVLMDIQMPGLSGLDATSRLRAKHYDRPIVALSAHAMLQDRDRSIEAGCNDHLTKPIQKETFIQRIEGLLQEQ